jgi:hypothetical protein
LGVTAEKKTKGMCIATRCTGVDQFVQMFARFVDEDSFFVSTHNTRPPGLETSFSVNLADGTPVLRGLCVVLQAWTDTNNVFKTPGVRLGIKRLTASSAPVFERLLVTRTPATPPPIPPSSKTAELDDAKTKVHPPKQAVLAERKQTETTKVDEEPEIETRTPGSDYVLPANPLMNLTDASLDGFVDCTLYEETGNFFPADDNLDEPMLTDDVVPPPVLATRRPTTAPVVAVPAPVTVLPANPLAEVTITSFVGPIPGSSVVTPLPAPEPMSDSVVTPLPEPQPLGVRADSVITPLPPPDYDLPLPPPMLPAIRETPVPAGERIDLAPHARRKKPPLWVLGGGFGVIAVATLAIVIGAKSSSGSSAPAQPAAKQPTPEVVAEVDLPKPAQPIVDDAQDGDKTDELAPKTGVTEDPDGPPMIGDGPCKLTIATTPAGSTISLDGKEMAPSPVTLATTCAKHKVDIAHVRYQTATKSVTLDEGTPGSLDVSLNRPTHAVSFTTTPSGATIFVDGRRAGTTPSVVNVIGFQRLKIELKKTGFQPQSTTLYSKKAQDAVSVKLKKW